MRTYPLLLFFILTFSCNRENLSNDAGTLSAYRSDMIYGQVDGLPGRKILLFSIYGEELSVIDSTMATSRGSFEFYFPPEREKGLYRIAMGKNTQPGYHAAHQQQFDIVWDYSAVVFRTHYASPVDSMKILVSEENRGYYQLLDRMNDYYRKIGILSSALIHYPADDNFYRRLERQYRRVQNRRSNYLDNLTKRNDGMIFASLARLHKMPLISSPAGDTSLEEMRQSFFFSGQFSDPVVLRSDMVPSKIVRYISLHQAMPGEDLWKRQERLIGAVDVIMEHAGENEEVFYFVLEYLINNLGEIPEMGMVVEHLTGKYLTGNICPGDTEAAGKRRWSPSPGSTIPGFTFTATDGRVIDIHGIDAEYTVLVFWGSWCPHCDDLMEDLYSLYSAYREKREGFLEIVAIGIETDREMWLGKIETGGYDWINYSSVKGWECPVADKFELEGTPTVLLLDSSKKFLQEHLRIRTLERFLSREF